MMPSISSGGLFQFSVEKAQSVRYSDPDLAGGVGDPADIFGPSLVALDARKALAVRPSAVAIHDDGNVAGNALQRESVRRPRQSVASTVRDGTECRFHCMATSPRRPDSRVISFMAAPECRLVRESKRWNDRPVARVAGIATLSHEALHQCTAYCARQRH